MSWLEALGKELSVRGVASRDRQRILWELGDHIDCDPGRVESLGAPATLATLFAEELATARSRRSAVHAFAALAVTAVALVVSQLLLGQIRYPGFNHGLSQALFWPSFLGLFVAPQVALASGTLGALRAFRRRHATTLPAAELALIARRTRIALAAGFSTAAGLELYVLNFSQRLPAWWLGMTAGLAATAGVALGCAWRSHSAAIQLRSTTPGPAGSILDDLPVFHLQWLCARPWRLGLVVSLITAVIMAALTAHAERSVIEGIQRGTAESLIAGTAFALLARSLGISTTRTNHIGRLRRAEFGFALGTRRVSDDDRTAAEHLLQDGFAHGRISLEELDQRIARIHTVSTQKELRAELNDLL